MKELARKCIRLTSIINTISEGRKAMTALATDNDSSRLLRYSVKILFIIDNDIVNVWK